MTVSTTHSSDLLAHTGPGSYAYTFPIFVEGDLQIHHVAVDDTETLLTLTTDYTVAIGGDGTGTITLIWDEPAGGPYVGNIRLRRILALTQAVDWVNNNALDMEILEKEFDRQLMMIQQNTNTILEGLTPEEQTAITINTNRLRGRFSSGVGDIENIALGSLTEEASPAALDMLIGFIADGSLREFDVDNFLNASFPTTLPTFLYAELSGSLALSVNTKYVDKAGASNAHTLPLLSGLAEGDRIELSIVASDRLVIINEHASDSNDEIWTGCAIGDYVSLMVIDGVWEVMDEKGPSFLIELALTTDDSISATTEEKVFDAGYSADIDIGGYWDSVTNHRFDFPQITDSLRVSVIIQFSYSHSTGMSTYPKLTGVKIRDSASLSGGVQLGNHPYLITGVKTDRIEFYTYNDTGSSASLMGHDDKDETTIKIMNHSRVRT